jgi:hypothetical protein
MISFHGDPSSQQNVSVSQDLSFWNRQINGYGPTKDIGNSIQKDVKSGLTYFGPQVGMVGLSSRTDTFLQSCAPHVSQDRIPAIRNAMNCANCHNDSDQTRLGIKNSLYLGNAPRHGFLEKVVYQLGVMPPGNDLSSSERGALVNCLVEENKQLWNSGVSAGNCSLSQGRGGLVGGNQVIQVMPSTCDTPASVEAQTGIDSQGIHGLIGTILNDCPKK